MRILVIGGAGYIGSHAVRWFADAGHDVWVYDNLSLGHAASVQAERLIRADLADTAAVDVALTQHRIEAVVHFAAFALVGESVRDPEKYYGNNTIATLNLLSACRRAKVGKFVFSSTCATYGVPTKVPIVEEEPQRPINPYGRSKLAVEWALEDFANAYADEFGFGIAALRYFNAAGASPQGDIGEDHDPETHLIPLCLQVALGQRPHLDILGTDYPTPDGTCIRDYIHVDDLASAHLLALEKLTPGAALKLNLGTGRGYSVREVVDTCRKVTGLAIPTREAPRRAGDPPALVAAADRAKQMLDWSPKYTTLEAIVESAWRWHQSHPQGFGE